MSMVEEPYQFKMSEDNKELLFKYIYRQNDYPAGWKKEFGKGKLFYFSPGHTVIQFKDKEYLKLIGRIIKLSIVCDQGSV